METENIKLSAIKFFTGKNLLLSEDFISNLNAFPDIDALYKDLVSKIKVEGLLVLSNDLIALLRQSSNIDVNWLSFERLKVLAEKGKNPEAYQSFVSELLNKKEEPLPKVQSPIRSDEAKVKTIISYEDDSCQRDVQDFVQFFNARYKQLQEMLKNRQELSNIMSIKRIYSKKEKDNISIIGIVSDKAVTKNNNIILTMEDPTGLIKVLINKNKPDLLKQCKDIILDEVIGVAGVNGDNIIFANNIVWPGIPAKSAETKNDKKGYAIFLSDLHVGSKNFLENDFNKFLSWLNQEIGSENQKEIAKKVKYVFIVGDLVDGVGVYPNQEKELSIMDIKDQYKECARLLAKIPKNIKIILCPGNHDAIRIAEPQPIPYKDFSSHLFDLKNIVMVSNPSYINIDADENFPGYTVLLYHGYSFDFIVSNVDSIRNKGGYNRADLIMKFLLKRRHLAPTHTATLYIPNVNKDPLVIDPIPDIFATGHIHKSSVSKYKGVTLISSSCWQSKTGFQEKVGHNPEPGRVPLIDLMTKQVKILKFAS